MKQTKSKDHPKVPQKLSYEKARELMSSSDPLVRKALAHHSDTPEEVLFFLAKDPIVEVRRAVAFNDKTPRKADLILTKDNDPNVRHQLANKIGRIMPDLSLDAKEAILEVTSEVLTRLAQDEVTYVRAMLSDMLKELPNVPANVIYTLANDKSLTVVEPVLQFSPVLGDKDLLDIINTQPLKGVIKAISKRDGVSEQVSGAIVDSGDGDAILSLLENETASIGEPTMGQILDKAPENDSWHGPLIRRPKLSQKTVIRLTDFVAMQLIDELQKRTDFDDDLLIQLTQSMETRIAKEAKEKEELPGSDWEGTSSDPEIAELFQKGELDQEYIEDALKKKKRKKVFSAIAALSGFSESIVANTLTQPRPKRICALCYKANLTAHFARQIQVQLAKLPSTLIIGPEEDGSYAIDTSELLEILNTLE